MNVTIHPGKLSGGVRVPASKSAAHRALIASALADGLTTVHIDALNDDIEATLECLMALGALPDYFERKGLLIIRPIGGAPGEAPAGKVLPAVVLRPEEVVLDWFGPRTEVHAAAAPDVALDRSGETVVDPDRRGRHLLGVPEYVVKAVGVGGFRPDGPERVREIETRARPGAMPGHRVQGALAPVGPERPRPGSAGATGRRPFVRGRKAERKPRFPDGLHRVEAGEKRRYLAGGNADDGLVVAFVHRAAAGLATPGHPAPLRLRDLEFAEPEPVRRLDHFEYGPLFAERNGDRFRFRAGGNGKSGYDESGQNGESFFHADRLFFDSWGRWRGDAARHGKGSRIKAWGQGRKPARTC